MDCTELWQKYVLFLIFKPFFKVLKNLMLRYFPISRRIKIVEGPDCLRAHAQDFSQGGWGFKIRPPLPEIVKMIYIITYAICKKYQRITNVKNAQKMPKKYLNANFIF